MESTFRGKEDNNNKYSTRALTGAKGSVASCQNKQLLGKAARREPQSENSNKASIQQPTWAMWAMHRSIAYNSRSPVIMINANSMRTAWVQWRINRACQTLLRTIPNVSSLGKHKHLRGHHLHTLIYHLEYVSKYKFDMIHDPSERYFHRSSPRLLSVLWSSRPFFI